MRWLRNLFRKRDLHCHADCFATTQQQKWNVLADWVLSQIKIDKCVLVVAHFQSTFLENEEVLSRTGGEFQVLSEQVTPGQLHQSGLLQAGKVLLTMAPILLPDPMSPSPVASQSPSEFELSVIVTERHPVASRDVDLASFFRQCPPSASIGYLMSFEDPILQRLLGKDFLNLLNQLGVGSHELISSTMTQRALNRQLAKNTIDTNNEQPAASPSEWLDLNLPDEAV